MGKLREAGLVDFEKRGIWIYYRLGDRLPKATKTLLNHVITR